MKRFKMMATIMMATYLTTIPVGNTTSYASVELTETIDQESDVAECETDSDDFGTERHELEEPVITESCSNADVVETDDPITSESETEERTEETCEDSQISSESKEEIPSIEPSIEDDGQEHDSEKEEPSENGHCSILFEGGSKRYDGQPISAKESVTGLKDGHTISYDLVDASRTEPGKQKPGIDNVHIYDRDGNDVTSQYTVDFQSTDLVVYAKRHNATANSVVPKPEEPVVEPEKPVETPEQPIPQPEPQPEKKPEQPVKKDEIVPESPVYEYESDCSDDEDDEAIDIPIYLPKTDVEDIPVSEPEIITVIERVPKTGKQANYPAIFVFFCGLACIAIDVKRKYS